MKLDNVDLNSPQEGSDTELSKGKLVVMFLMVLCLVVASFFGGYYYSQKMATFDCNHYIQENNLVNLNELFYQKEVNNNGKFKGTKTNFSSNNIT